MLQKELANLEANELKESEALMEEAKHMTGDFLDQVKGVGGKLDARAKEFHDKVDEIFKASKRKLKDLKNTSLAIFYQQEKMVSDGLEKVKQEIKEYEDKLRISSKESLLQYEDSQEREKVTLPKIISVMPPLFTPSQMDDQSLIEMFGNLEQQVQGAKARTVATPQKKASGNQLYRKKAD